MVARHGITRGMFDVLAALRRAGAPHRLTPTQLSAALLLSGAGMTSRLDRLEEAGLAVRLPEPADRRSILIGLTRKGLALVDRMLPELIGIQRAALGIGTAKARDLTALLWVLGEHLAAEGD
nr:MarR family transcriptional regulator [Roseomonas acroporae]